MVTVAGGGVKRPPEETDSGESSPVGPIFGGAVRDLDGAHLFFRVDGVREVREGVGVGLAEFEEVASGGFAFYEGMFF